MRDRFQAWRTGRLGTLGTPQVEFLNRAERYSTRGRSLYTPADAMVALFVLRPDIVEGSTTTNVQVRWRTSDVSASF